MKKILKIYFLLMVLVVYLPSAYAVPSFARQTGMDCAACHTSFPELTPFGREFKLNGYTLGERQLVPIAAMAQLSLTHVDKKSNSNGTYMQRQDDPTLDSIGLFLAGKITDNAGAFIQATYNNVNARNSPQGVSINHHSHSDNTDLRLIGNHQLFGKDLVVGLNVNNNPTVQDVWNSTPAWGFPFVGSALAGVGGSGGGIGGGHATQIEGGLAQQSAGVGAYFWWNRQLYGELSMYGTADKIFRPMSLGNWYNNANNFALQSRNNPYWRLAYSRDWGSNSLMLGTYGMDLNLYPDATKRSGPTDHFLDTAIDTQYQFITDPHIATLQATYIHEKQTLNATYLSGGSNNLNNSLNTFRAKASYLYDRKYGATVYFVENTGSRDAGLYTGNPTARPNTRYYIIELDYNPTTQARISLQYTFYNMIDGVSFNYDGTGRKASDNNTLFLYSWLAF